MFHFTPFGSIPSAAMHIYARQVKSTGTFIKMYLDIQTEALVGQLITQKSRMGAGDIMQTGILFITCLKTPDFSLLRHQPLCATHTEPLVWFQWNRMKHFFTLHK